MDKGCQAKSRSAIPVKADPVNRLLILKTMRLIFNRMVVHLK